MRITKGFPKRLAAGLMSLVMTLTLLPALSAPAEAITADDVNYADGPNWFSIDKGSNAHERLKTLSMLLRYQKGNSSANAANGIADAFASAFDPHYSGDTMYIRLDYDIEVEFDVEEERGKLSAEDTPQWLTANWHCNLPVYGKKVLDLNGHTVKIWAKDGADCAFEIRNGATLTVVDSRGGGKMCTDTYIYGVGGGGVIDLFHVNGGGKLILNAPDAEFECGRSKKQTYHGYAVNGNHRSDAGAKTVRGQSNGSAVVVENGGSLTVAGGTLRGRGYSFITKWGYAYYTDPVYQAKGAEQPKRCAAILARSGASVHIIDGAFFGKGGADALQIEFSEPLVSLTIESGVFDVSKVDRLALPSATNDGKWIDGEFVWTNVNRDKSNYMDGSDGAIGIPQSVLTALAKEKGSAVDIIQGGHTVDGSELDDAPDLNTYNSSNAVTICPTGEMHWAGSHMQLTYAGGNETIDPVHQDSFKVTATYDGYYSDAARKLLASDYRPRDKALGKNDVEHYYEWKFDLYDYNDYCWYGHGHRNTNKTRKALYTGMTTSDEPQITVDLLDLTKFTQDAWKELKTGAWMLCCEVTEVWKGEHTYELPYYDSTLLRVKDNANILSALMNDGFEPGIDICHTDPTFNNVDGEATTSGLAQYLTCALDEETQIALDTVIEKYEKDHALSLSRQKIKTEYEIYHYGANRYSWWERYGQGLRADLTWDRVAEDDIGPVEVLTRLWVPEWNLSASASDANDAGAFRGTNLMEWSQYFLYLPAMTVTDNGTKTRVGFDQPVELPEGGNVQIQPNRTNWLAGFKEKNPGTVTWQWYKSDILGLDSSERSFWRNVEEGIYAKYDTDDKAEGSVVLRNSGTYRLVMTYTSEWNGKEQNFVSVPIEVHGNDKSGLRASLYSPNPNVTSLEDLNYANLYLQLSEGTWNQVDSISMRMMEAPAGIKRSPAVEVPVVKDQRNYRVYLRDFDIFKEHLNGNSGTDPAGTYTFRATIKGKDNIGYSYTIYSVTATVTLQKEADTYALVADGRYLGAGYKTLRLASEQQVPLYLDSSKDTVTLDLAYSPQNATYDSRFNNKGLIKYEWFVMENENSIRLPGGAGESSAIRASILRPGTSIIGCTKTAGPLDKPYESVTTYFKVCVPVTEVEVTLPDYQDEIGQYYRDILPTFVAKTASGATLPDDCVAFNFRYDAEWKRTEYAPSFDSGSLTGTDRFNKQVAGNDKGRVTYTFQLTELDGLSFPLRPSYISSLSGEVEKYEVDLSAVRLSIKQADGTTVTMSAEEWGAKTDKTFDTGTLAKPHNANFTLTQDVFVKDPDAVYINTVSITTSEPHVGDPVNEQITVYYNGSPQGNNGLKKVDVVNWPKTTKGTLLIAPYTSYVSKADSTTVGEPYTDASDAKADGQNAWMYDTFKNDTYKAGTYFHELQLQTSSDPAASDGKVHCFAPNAKVFLNGKLLDFGGVTYNKSGYSYLSLSYFYNVTEADEYDDITLDDITPKQGEMPADSLTVKKTGSGKKLDVNVSDITWFVDANENGRLDEGEEVDYQFEHNEKYERTRYKEESSTLWYDGSFLPGVAYSVQLKLEPGDHTTRFKDPLTIRCGKKTVTVSDVDDPIVLTFDKDYTIYTISLQVDSYMTDRDPWKLFNTTRGGFTAIVNSVQAHNTAMDSVSITGKDIAEYLTGTNLKNEELAEGNYWLTLLVSQGWGYQFAENVKVRINDSSTGDFAYGLERIYALDVKKSGSGEQVRILKPFHAPGSGTDKTDLSGTVTSFGSTTDPVTVKLLGTVYERTLTGNSATYSFFEVPNGTYTMQVSKKDHVTESVDLVLSGTAVTQNVTLSLLGDVNGDNAVDILDLQTLFAHLQGASLITDAKKLKAADTTGDGTIDILDYQRLFAFLQGKVTSLS